jgi:hypothetical protein
MKSFKRHKDYDFWYQDLRLSKIGKLGNPLKKINTRINFEILGELLEKKFIFSDLTIADGIPDSRTGMAFRRADNEFLEIPLI